MKVFISWSGNRSQALAQILREWLPLVLDYVEPWVSETDIAAGDRWAQVIGTELEASNFGIICITPENLTSPWVLFEAGALAKSMQDGKVIPLLHDLDFTDITDPLAQFQAKKVNQAGVSEVIQAIEKASDNKSRDDLTKRRFNGLWPEFEESVKKIPERLPTEKHMRPQTEVLEELVSGVRGLDTRLHDFSSEFIENGPRQYSRKFRRFHPEMLHEMMHRFSEDENDPILLLMLGGMLREYLPWLAEIFIETYREIRTENFKRAEQSVRRLRRIIKMMHKRSFFEMFMLEESKEAHMMMMELPMMLDETLHRYLRRYLRHNQSIEVVKEQEDKNN